MAQETTAMTTALFDTAHRPRQRAAPAASDLMSPTLLDLLARKDDRLLRDIGLVREDVLGPEGLANVERLRNRAIWSL